MLTSHTLFPSKDHSMFVRHRVEILSASADIFLRSALRIMNVIIISAAPVCTNPLYPAYETTMLTDYTNSRRLLSSLSCA